MSRRAAGHSSSRRRKKKPPDSNNHCSSQEDDPNKLRYLCRKPVGGQFMIQYNQCGEWMHGSCVGVSHSQGQQLEENSENFLCPLCDLQTSLPSVTPNQTAFLFGALA